jgi:hypothetical protein
MNTCSGDRTATQQFLIHCLRAFLNSEDTSSLKTFPHDAVDWSVLLRLASEHGVVPFLYRCIITARPEGMPEDIRHQLKEQLDFNLRRNLHLTAELLNVLNLLDTHGIRVIPYKGPALASYLYGNLGLRQFADLDILVRKEDILKAKELLLSHGYQPSLKLNRAQEAALLRTDIEYVFYREGSRALLEVHWDVAMPDSFRPRDFESLWTRCEPLSLAGRTIFHPSKEDLLLILCAHTGKHFVPKLAWFCDIAQLLRMHQQMDWERIMWCANTSTSRRLLFPVLFLSKDLLGAPLAEEVWQKVQKDPAIGRLAAQIRERLFIEPGALPGVWGITCSQLKLREGVRDRLRYCLQLMTPPPGDCFIPLPEPLSPLYYVFRSLRLTGKYGPKAISHIYNRCKEKIKWPDRKEK